MTTQTTDDRAINQALGAWLARTLEVRDVRVENLETPESGFSARTWLFDACWEDQRVPMVARVAPLGPGLFPEYDLVKEARVIAALAEHTDVPVADVVGVEADVAVLGAEFLVMRRTPGLVPLDDPPWSASGWVIDLPPAGRTQIFDTFIDVLAKLHAADPVAMGLGFLARPEDGGTPLEQHLAKLERYYDFGSDGRRDNPVVDAGLQWLYRHRPQDEEPTAISWGDCQPHNLIYAEDLSAAAALDWEMVEIASPELDVGALTFCMQMYTDGAGIARPDGFPDRAEIVSKYEAASGRTLKHLGYYEVLTAVRSAAIMQRLGHLLIAAGTIPADSGMPLANPSSITCARMIGAPEPRAGQAGSLFS